MMAESSNIIKDKAVKETFNSECEEARLRNFLSSPVFPTSFSKCTRKISSEPNVYRGVNYDDLCGPWSFPDNPAHTSCDVALIPKLCTWQFITSQDILYIKNHQHSKEAILLLIESKLPRNVLFTGANRDIFLKLMWEVFQFVRSNHFTEKGVSSLLGLFYLTHCFFLSNSWRTTAETYRFFQQGILLHSVLQPPKSDEVFTPTECSQSLNLFWSIYMRHLALLRFTCLPNYRLTLVLQKQALKTEEKELPLSSQVF